MENLYVDQAQKAFNAKEYRKCLAFLGNIKIWNVQSVELLVQSSYIHWKTALENKSTGNYDSALALAHKAFTRLLDGGIPHELISAEDYIMLTHIYLCEGNLTSALMITNLASARGYLEDILIVTQSFLILKRLGKSSDVSRYYDFMVSKLLLISSTLHGNLHSKLGETNNVLCAIFLFCANQLRVNMNISRNQELPHEKILLFQTFCGSAFYLYSQKKSGDLGAILDWFKDHEIWMSLANQLKKGPFILLAEELYWVCFCRSTLEELYVSLVYGCMVETNRFESIPLFLGNVFSMAPWNLFVREKLLNWAITSSDNKGVQWSELLQMQNISIVKVQKFYRGYRLRKNWQIMVNNLRKIRDEFYRKILVSDQMFSNYQKTMVGMLFKSWKGNVKILKYAKVLSAVRVQAFYRASGARWNYAKRRKVIMEANSKFLVASLMQNARLRFRYFRKWFDNYFEIRKRHAAQTISDVLIANGYNQLLVKGMSVILALLRIHRVHEVQRRFKHWINRYQAARKRHAVATIRFFVRRSLLRAADKVVEEKLMKLEMDVSVRRTTEFRSNYLPLLRQMWLHWYKLFNNAVNFRKRCRMVLCLQTRFRRSQAHKVLQSIFIRHECQTTFVRSNRIKRISLIFKFWRSLRSSRVLQRAFRCHHAFRRFAKLLSKKNRITAHHENCLYKWKKKIWHHWIRFVYIAKKDAKRQRLGLVDTWNRWKYVAQLAKAILRKDSLAKLCGTLHKVFMRCCFRRMVEHSKGALAQRRLKTAIVLLTRYNIRNTFHKLRTQCSLQAILKLQLRKLGIATKRNVLITLAYTRISYCFEVWKILHDSCYQHRVDVASNMAAIVWKQLIWSIDVRNRCVVKIQSAVRGYKCRLQAKIYIARLRIMDEVITTCAGKMVRVFWKKWYSICTARIKAKHVLNKFFSMITKRLQVDKYDKINQQNNQKIELIRTAAKFKLSELKRSFQAFIIAFLFETSTIPLDKLLNNIRHRGHSETVIKNFKHSRKDPLRGGYRLNKIPSSFCQKFEFQSELFHATMQSTLRTHCLIYDNSVDVTHDELLACIHHASSVFISKIDHVIIEGSKHFRGKKIVIHDCDASSLLVSLVGAILFQSEQNTDHADNKTWSKIQLHFININARRNYFLQVIALMCDSENSRLYLRRDIEEIEFNTTSIGYLCCLKLMFMVKVSFLCFYFIIFIFFFAFLPFNYNFIYFLYPH